MRGPFVNLEQVLLSTLHKNDDVSVKPAVKLNRPDHNKGEPENNVDVGLLSRNSTTDANPMYVWGISIGILLLVVVWGIVDYVMHRSRMCRIETMLRLLCIKNNIPLML